MSSSVVPAYDFLAPPRIAFGWGRWREVAAIAGGLGSRAFIVSGSRSLEAAGVFDELCALLAERNVATVRLETVRGEPTVADVDRVAAELRQHGPRPGDLVLALGGGSAIDLGKAVAAMATNTAGGSVRDYLEGVGSGLKLVERPLPVIALPTTAGTGSEATKNAVISVDDPAVKKSLRSEEMIPKAVVIDPELSVSVPRQITAHTGMDAITQCIESYISRRAKPIPQALAAQGLQLAIPAIVEAVENGGSRPAREAMAHAALLSGMALANSGLGMAHGVAAALGVHAGVAHGLACAVMLPAALEANREVSERRLAELARLTGISTAAVDEEAAAAFIERIAAICRRVGIPDRLREVGVRGEQIPALVKDSRGNSMDGNPRTLADEELHAILEARL